MASDAELARAFAATFLLGEPTHPLRNELLGVLLRPGSYTRAPQAAHGGTGSCAPSYHPAHAGPGTPLGALPGAQPYYSAPPHTSWQGTGAPYYPPPYWHQQPYLLHTPPPAAWPPPHAYWPHVAPGWPPASAEAYGAAAPQSFVHQGERAHMLKADRDHHRVDSTSDRGYGSQLASTPRRSGGRARASERAARPPREADESSGGDDDGSRRSDESAHDMRAPSVRTLRSAQPDERTGAQEAPVSQQRAPLCAAARQPAVRTERAARRGLAAAEAAPQGEHAAAETRPDALALARASALALLDELAAATGDRKEASDGQGDSSEAASNVGASHAQCEVNATLPSDTPPPAIDSNAATMVRLAIGSRVIVRAAGEHRGKRGVVVALDTADVIVRLDGAEGGILQSAIEVLAPRDVALVSEADIE